MDNKHKKNFFIRFLINMALSAFLFSIFLCFTYAGMYFGIKFLIISITYFLSFTTAKKTLLILMAMLIVILCMIVYYERLLVNHKKEILFRRIRDEAIIPSRTKGNAGFDIYGLIPQDREENTIIIKPHTTELIPTGIKSVIPEGYYIQIHERGSSGSKGIKYSAGVIDSSYRGEWFMATTNTNDKPVIFYDSSNIWVNKFKRENPQYEDAIYYPLSKAIFQGVIHSTHNEFKTRIVSEQEFKKHNSSRGDGKLGSSGK